ncbi:hypothetical protein ACS0TY_003897 [Phlomoides rotata]
MTQVKREMKEEEELNDEELEFIELLDEFIEEFKEFDENSLASFFSRIYDNYICDEDELATAFMALDLAFEKQWYSFWLETDSSYVAHVLKNRSLEVPWRLLSRWHRVRRRLEQMSFIVSHIFREGNASADRLTREPMDKFEWWNQAPSFLIPFLCKDRTSDFYCFNGT